MNDYTLIHDDCIHAMSEMADNSVQAIITDPSYSLPNNQFRPEARIKQRTYGEFSTYNHFFKLFIDQSIRVLKPDGDFIVFCDETFYPVIYPFLYEHFYATKLLVWNKGRIGMGGIWRRQFELITHSYMQPKKVKSGDSDILTFNPVREKLHTSQKPVDLLEKLVLKTTQEGDTVLDPFMGSGSTGVAALKHSRQFIGIDIGINAVTIAEDRLKEIQGVLL